MKKAILFVLLIMQMFAFEIFSGIKPNIVLPMLVFTLFYRIAVFPINIFVTYRKKKSSQKSKEKKGLFNEGCLYFIVTLLLSIVAFTSVVYMSELVPRLCDLSPEQLEAAYTLFGITLRGKGFSDILVVIPIVYFLFSRGVPAIIKRTRYKAYREKMTAGMSDEDKEMYLEEEKKARKKKYTITWFLLKALSLYGLAIALFLPRYLVLYLLFSSMWRMLFEFFLFLMFRKKNIAISPSVSTESVSESQETLQEEAICNEAELVTEEGQPESK